MKLKTWIISAVLLTAAACQHQDGEESALKATVTLPAGLKKLPAVDGDVMLTVTTGPKAGMKVTSVNPVEGLGDQTKESIYDFCSSLTFAGETGWKPLTEGEAHTLQLLKLKLVPGYLTDLWIGDSPGRYALFAVGHDSITRSSELIASARAGAFGVVCAKDAGSNPVFGPAADIVTCHEGHVNNFIDHIVTMVVRQDGGALSAKISAQKGSVDWDAADNMIMNPEGPVTSGTMSCEKIDDQGTFGNGFTSYRRDILKCAADQPSGSGLFAKTVTLTYHTSPAPHSTDITRSVIGAVNFKGESGSVELWCDMDLGLLDTWND